MKTIGEDNIPGGGKLPKSLITVNLGNIVSGIYPEGVKASVGKIICNRDGLHPDFTNISEGNPDDIIMNANDLFMNSYRENTKEKGEIPITLSLDTDNTILHPNIKITKTIESKRIN